MTNYKLSVLRKNDWSNITIFTFEELKYAWSFANYYIPREHDVHISEEGSYYNFFNGYTCKREKYDFDFLKDKILSIEKLNINFIGEFE